MDVQVLNSWPEYRAVRKFYGNRTAERSKVPLIRHIHEGIAVMESKRSSSYAMRAYCLHPLVQNDSELVAEGFIFLRDEPEASPMVAALAMEYRAKANAWLSDKVQLYDGQLVTMGWPDPGPLVGVRLMLIADKVQNFKDFMLHHCGTHPRSKELYRYFQCWFSALGVTDQVDDLIAHVNREFPSV